MNNILNEVTQRIIKRSETSRAAYVKHMQDAGKSMPERNNLGCGNLAHGFAACSPSDKQTIRLMESANVGIISAYNDMLSAHQPYEVYPDKIRKALNEIGCTAQFAGGVPAMCDGVTQGQPGMELSLFSRDQIAMSAAIGLSHNMFDGALFLGVCDKIVPGLVIAACRFGYLPSMFVPAGPMESGLPNKEKARVRQEFAKGNVDREALMDAESASYHSAGTCTFYGTANTNQMLMEFMGLQLPGSSFVNPGTELREALTTYASKQVTKNTALSGTYRPVYKVLDEKAFVNGIVGLLSTGGSTNLTIHLIAMAAAAGIKITWEDFSDLSKVVPLLARVYPNGQADVNHFHAAGGLAFMIRELLDAGLLHDDVTTIVGESLRDYAQEPWLNDGKLEWRDINKESLDEDIVRKADNPFNPEGGMQVLKGNLGVGVIKTSAVALENQIVEAPAIVFETQHELEVAFKKGELEKDFIAVVRFQGPQANGMPELHKMTPPLGVLQDKGFKVALVTDGRMSGASGKVPAAIHMSPEAIQGGPLAKVKNGDVIRLDATTGVCEIKVSETDWHSRKLATFTDTEYHYGAGREMFSAMRENVTAPEQGGTVFKFEE